MNELPLEARIEAILFTRSEPVGRDDLRRLFRVDAATIDAALGALAQQCAGRGVALVDDGREVELRTSPDAAECVEAVRKEELSRDIGKAGLETLAIVLYKGPSTRSQIDFIRGVNSSHILRMLTMRGFVRRIDNPDDERSYLYEPTTDLLAALGARKAEDVPEYAAIAEELGRLMNPAEKANDHASA